MPIIDDIAAVRQRQDLTGRQKDLSIYELKNAALRDVIINGKPAPNPIPPVLGRTFTLDGTTVRVNACSLVPRVDAEGNTVEALYIDVTLTRNAVTVTHQVYYINPPVLPRSVSGNEKQDLIAAASEMIAQIPVA